MRSSWVTGVRALLIVGGLVIASYGIGVTTAMAAPAAKDDPHAGLTPNWDKKLPTATRFVVLADFATTTNGAVRDNETGLVWEQAPDGVSTFPWNVTAASQTAAYYCANKSVGGRKGWRLPSVAELSSLVDPNSTVTPTLPVGHPFIVSFSQVPILWSATTSGANSTDAWRVPFIPGGAPAGGDVATDPKTNSHFAWCVRGGTQESVY